MPSMVIECGRECVSLFGDTKRTFHARNEAMLSDASGVPYEALEAIALGRVPVLAVKVPFGADTTTQEELLAQACAVEGVRPISVSSSTLPIWDSTYTRRLPYCVSRWPLSMPR